MFRHLRLVITIATLFALAGNVQSQTFSSVVVFGDSLSDSGNIARIARTPGRHKLHHEPRSGLG